MSGGTVDPGSGVDERSIMRKDEPAAETERFDPAVAEGEPVSENDDRSCVPPVSEAGQRPPIQTINDGAVHDPTFVSDPVPGSSSVGTCAVPGKIELMLSRQTIHRGESIVGTLRLTSPVFRTKKDSNKSDISSSSSSSSSLVSLEGEREEDCRDYSPHPQSHFQDTSILIIGMCRVDSRWHNTQTVSEIYGKHPLLTDDIQNKFPGICFFAAKCSNVSEESHAASASSPASLLVSDSLPQQQSFAFVVDLPVDLPPTTNLLSCRYYYIAAARAVTPTQTHFVQIPFLVHTSSSPSLLPTPDALPTSIPRLSTCSARVKIGHCTVFPFHPPSHHTLPHPRARLSVTPSTSDRNTPPKQLRITDPRDVPCCLLSIFGISPDAVATRGSRLFLKFDFPRSNDNPSVVPCFQIGARLDGAEFVTGGEDANGLPRKAKTWAFDSAHSLLSSKGDPHESNNNTRADSVTLRLSLPVDCPCTFRTHLVHVCVALKVELTVAKGGEEGGYEVLRLEIPLEVVHDLIDCQDHEREEEERRWISAHDDQKGGILAGGDRRDFNEIRSDLANLAVCMTSEKDDRVFQESQS